LTLRAAAAAAPAAAADDYDVGEAVIKHDRRRHLIKSAPPSRPVI